MSQSPTAIIIGAGVAGLATATRLAVQGFQVTVFEKNSYPGGKLHHFSLGDYQFDAGPSLFTQPQNIEALFALAGEPIEKYFKYDKINITCKYFYDDATIVNAYADTVAFAKELHEKLGEDEESVIAYLNRSRNIYNNIGSIFLEHSLHKKQTLTSAPITKALAATRPAYLFSTMHAVNTSSFKSAHAVQLFDRYATYNGSNPYKAPGMLTLIPHLEFNEGVYYPEGGMISITNALHKLAIKKGVQFNFNTAVDKIIYNEGKAVGVVANHQNYLSDVVVSNMDVYYTYKNLLNNERKAKHILKQERSSSAFIFYWGIKKEFKELELHNIFFKQDYKAEFDNLFNLKEQYNDPTIYINVTSKCEPGKQAPPGRENWFVMINAAADTGQDWQAYQKLARQAVIQKLNKILHTDIAPLIEEEAVLSPTIIDQQTASYGGSLYGTSSNSKFAAFLRHPNFSNAIKNLYFTGGSVHPGGGIPLCLKSAAITSDIIATDIAAYQKH